MKVLLDGAAALNLGDIGMMEAAAWAWLVADPEVEVCAVDRVGHESFLWPLMRVTRVKGREIAVYRAGRLGFLEEMPLLWRLGRQRRESILSEVSQRLGNGLRASSLPLEAGGGASTLGEFCSDYDALHLSGGGNLTDTFPFEMIRKCALAICFREQGKPVIATGQQVGPFAHDWGNQLVMRVLRNTAFLGVREPLGSVKYCMEAGLRGKKVVTMGDDSFGLPEADPNAVDRLLASVGLRGQAFLAVNLRAAGYMASTDMQMDLLANAVRELSALSGLPVLVVPIALGESDSDVASGRRLAERVGNGIVRVLDGPHLNATLARGVLGRAVAGVGTSYHFCTFTLSMGVTAVCLYDGAYYTQKAEGLAAFWGDPGLMCSFAQLRLPGAVPALYKTLSDAGLRKYLQRRAQAVVGGWTTYFAQAAAMLESECSACARAAL